MFPSPSPTGKLEGGVWAGMETGNPQKNEELLRNCLDVGGQGEVTVLSWCRGAMGAAAALPTFFGRSDMASNKTKTTDAAEVNGVPAADDAASAAGGPEATGRKLRWNSLKAPAGVAHRTKKPKAKKAAAPKAATSKTSENKTKAGKLSALDAAAKVLQEAGQPMNCQDMIKAMADKGYWTSPAGKTPAATLYSALAREIKTKGKQARFQKTARGQFVYQTPQAS
jgi:hypothetical protein